VTEKITTFIMRLKADLTLLFVALLWGSGFAVMRVAAQYDIIFLLNGLRFLLGGLIILPFIHIKQAFLPKGLLPIVLAGLALFSATTLQQAGLKTTTAGNTGFHNFICADCANDFIYRLEGATKTGCLDFRCLCGNRRIFVKHEWLLQDCSR